MKKQKEYHAWVRTLIITMTLFLVGTTNSHAQDVLGVGEYRTKAITSMEAGNWPEALQFIDGAIKSYDERAMTLYGGKFGWFWYFKGVCELKLKKNADAATSFETCYTKYPSNKEESAGGGSTGSDNFFHKTSLIKWGDALKASGDYAAAIAKYKQFLKEREKKDKYDKGMLEINLSYCHSKTKQLGVAISHLENAIKVKKSTKSPPNKAIMSAFYVLADSAIDAKDEKVILKFLNDHRGDISLNPARMREFVPLFMTLSSKAYQAGMKGASTQFYGMIPGSLQMEDDIQAYLNAVGSYTRPIRETNGTISKEELEADLKKVTDRTAKDDGPEVTSLAAAAFVHEQVGNVHGAYTAYRQLEEFYPKRPKREFQLYQLTRTSSLVGDVLETLDYGETFLKDYPSSEHEESVQSLMLTGLFQKGKYEKVLVVASEMLPDLEPGEKQHDICQHVLGASHYYLGHFDKAHPLLKKHVEEYGEKSLFKAAVYYLYAANLSRLQEWELSAKNLDIYMEKFPTTEGNPYLSFAFYDRANCHYSLEEMNEALSKLETLEKKYSDSAIMDAALNLRGNIYQAEDDVAKAEVAYRKAFELAESRSNGGIAGEAAYYLVALLGGEKLGKEDNTRMAEAIPFYDVYWEKYAAGSPFKAQMAVAGVLSLSSSGRSKEALETLQGVIAQMAKNPGARGIEEAINSYTEAYLKEHTPEQLKEHYYNFPGIDSGDKATLALLRIAIIGVFEDELKAARTAKDQSRVDKAEANIKVLFNKLDTDFKPADLSNYILVRVGDYLRLNTSDPRKALKYYEQIINGKNPEHRFAAIFGYAEILGNSDNAEDQKKALDQLELVYKDSPEKEEKEKSLYRIITTLANQGNWAGLDKRAREYKDREKKYNKFLAHVSYLLALSYDKRNMSDDAHREYVSFRGPNYGLIKYSAPATKRIIEIVWKRNRPASEKIPKSDRQMAYEDGWNFVNSTERILDKLSDEEVKMRNEVQKLVEQYEKSGQITDMATIKKQAEEAR